MNITAQDVNKLRQMTGAGMMDCKKALTESNGDFETAIEILRKKGQKVSASRADRQTSEGSLFIRTVSNDSEAFLIALNCETDFVAKNEEFKSLGNAIIDAVVKERPADIDSVKKLKLGNLSVGEKITELVGKIGEKIDLSSYEVISGEKVVSYIHANHKLGVVVALKGATAPAAIEAGKNVAMQIAAMNPIAIDKDNVDPKVIEKEIEIGKEQARAEGKPEAMLEKIAIGKLNKFYKESTLLNQDYVKDSSVTVGKYLESVSKGLTVVKFRRITLA
ncbi:MAG TPA: translation elongation factor Ts [Cyclobacteriaceae bacterium]|nr:translation elongation factor Ts [Cyclobacteriaceae bacterium]